MKANAKVIKMSMFIQTQFKRTIGAYQLSFVLCLFVVLNEVMRRKIRIHFSFLIILAICLERMNPNLRLKNFISTFDIM